MPVKDIVRYETVTAGPTATGLTTTVGTPPILPQAAEIVVEGAAIRYRVDGGAPAANEGVPVGVGGVITLVQRDELVFFRATKRDEADATLRVVQGLTYIP